TTATAIQLRQIHDEPDEGHALNQRDGPSEVDVRVSDHRPTAVATSSCLPHQERQTSTNNLRI
ncbi:hypothetical protein K443DRAFT_109854, partial [Laccaria amethystina LaAM-08-1]